MKHLNYIEHTLRDEAHLALFKKSRVKVYWPRPGFG